MLLIEHRGFRGLLLSMAVPVSDGSPEQVQAWQALLRMAQTHQVDVACVAATPVHLMHWRGVHQHAQRIIMVRPTLAMRLKQHLQSWIGGGESLDARVGELRMAIQPWIDCRTYDTVVCSDRRLWPIAQAIDVPGRIAASEACGTIQSEMLRPGATESSVQRGLGNSLAA